MSKKKFIYPIVGIIVILMGFLVYSVFNKKDDKVVQLNKVEENENKNDDSNTSGKTDQKKADELEESLKKKNKDGKLTDDDEQLIEAVLSGVGMDYDLDESPLEMPVFVSDESLKHHDEFGIRFHRPKEIKGFLEDAGSFYVHHMIGDRYIPFKVNSGNVFGLVNVDTNYSHKTYEKNVDRFIGNRFKEQFFYLKSYGDEKELFYNEVGPSVPESVKYFDEKITIKSGIFYKDLLFYSYGKSSNGEGDITKNNFSEVIPVPYEEGDPSPYEDFIKTNDVSAFGTDGERLYVYANKNRTFYELTDGNPKELLKLSEDVSVGEILVQGDSFVANVRSGEGELLSISNKTKGQLDLPVQVQTYDFIAENIIITSTSDGNLLAYNLDNDKYISLEYMSGTISVDFNEQKIYFLSIMGPVYSMDYEVL